MTVLLCYARAHSFASRFVGKWGTTLILHKFLCGYKAAGITIYLHRYIKVFIAEQPLNSRFQLSLSSASVDMFVILK